MSQEDREKWNYRYATGDHASFEPSPLLVAEADWLPTSGRALDVAGGAGRHARRVRLGCRRTRCTAGRLIHPGFRSDSSSSLVWAADGYSVFRRCA